MSRTQEIKLPEVVTADWLLKQYGDDAYGRGVQLALDALKMHDNDRSKQLSAALAELPHEQRLRRPWGKR